MSRIDSATYTWKPRLGGVYTYDVGAADLDKVEKFFRKVKATIDPKYIRRGSKVRIKVRNFNPLDLEGKLQREWESIPIT